MNYSSIEEKDDLRSSHYEVIIIYYLLYACSMSHCAKRYQRRDLKQRNKQTYPTLGSSLLSTPTALDPICPRKVGTYALLTNHQWLRGLPTNLGHRQTDSP